MRAGRIAFVAVFASFCAPAGLGQTTVQPPRNVRGDLIAVEGDVLLIRPARTSCDGVKIENHIRIRMDERTDLLLDGDDVEPADLATQANLARLNLAPAMKVYITTRRARRGAPERTGIVASTDSWRGTVIDIRDNGITILTRSFGRGGETRAGLTMDETTVVYFGGLAREAARMPARVGTMRELRPGMHVTVTGEWGPKKIYVQPYALNARR